MRASEFPPEGWDAESERAYRAALRREHDLAVLRGEAPVHQYEVPEYEADVATLFGFPTMSRFRPYCRPNGWWTVEDTSNGTFLVTEARQTLQWATDKAPELEISGPGTYTWEKIA